MAGHSHAANIAVRKGKQDRLRAKIFSKLSKDIMIAARGGPDPSMNFTLRHAIEKARAQSMPKDKIEHAIKKGAGLIEGERVEELIYEGYAPSGVALIIEIVTDKPSRTRPEISNIMNKNGGNLGSSNSVLYAFQHKGLFAVPVEKIAEDELMELALEAGADDISRSEDVYEIVCPLEQFQSVQEALERKNIETTVSELRYLADNQIEVDAETARKVLNLIEKLEDNDDVNKVHSNMKYDQTVLKVLQEA